MVEFIIFCVLVSCIIEYFRGLKHLISPPKPKTQPPLPPMPWESPATRLDARAKAESGREVGLSADDGAIQARGQSGRARRRPPGRAPGAEHGEAARPARVERALTNPLPALLETADAGATRFPVSAEKNPREPAGRLVHNQASCVSTDSSARYGPMVIGLYHGKLDCHAGALARFALDAALAAQVVAPAAGCPPARVGLWGPPSDRGRFPNPVLPGARDLFRSAEG